MISPTLAVSRQASQVIFPIATSYRSPLTVTVNSYAAITVLPGTQWIEAYQFASDNGVTIAGGVGANASVGAGGGWPMGAGHNIMSPTLDLGMPYSLARLLIGY